MILLQLLDFTGGKYNIPDSSSGLNSSKLTQCINSYEKKYIYELLGAALGTTMIAYLEASQSPVNADLKVLIDSFAEDSTDCRKPMYTSAGLKEYLKAAIFYEYTNNGLRNTLAGVAKRQGEVSKVQDPTSTLRYAEKMYNDQMDTIEAIQWKCRNNPSTYPTYNGKKITAKFSGYGL